MAQGSEQGQSRKDQAVQGAIEALASYGLGSLSFDHVAEKSGMSRQLIRHYFPDQEVLMVAVCDRLAQLYRDPLIAIASSLDGPGRISAFLDFYFDLLADRPKPRDDRVYDAMMALSASSVPIRTALANQYGLLGQVLSHEFAVQYPALKQRSARELSFLFVSMMYGHWKMVASLGYSEAHNRVTRQAMDRLIASYVETPALDLEGEDVWHRS